MNTATNELNALYLRRNDLWNNQPRCNLAASKEVKEAYMVKEEAWLTAMHEIDSQIAKAKKTQAA